MLRLNIFGRFRAVDALGNEIPIKSRKARALLAYLALPPGKPRSREQLATLLWSDRGDEQARGSLRQALSGLRRDLGDGPAVALRIADDAVALDPEHVVVQSPSPGDELLEGLHINDPAFEEWLRDERLRLEGESATEPESRPLSPMPPDRPTVAILPFQNLSDGAEQEYFADGVTVDIATQLSRFRTISVISSWITSHFKGDFPRVEEVQERFGAGYVATGTVRTAANRIRVSVQLLDAATCQTVWAENYDRTLGDVFVVQDEITARIVSTIAGQLEERHRQLQTVGREQNLTNYQNLLLAERSLRQGSEEEILKARALFEKVVAAEPLNARAHSGLARSYLDELWSDWTTAADGIGTLGLRSALRAVELDPLDARARINLGVAYQLVASDFEKAKIQFDKARELNPNDAEAFCQSGWCYALSGDLDSAMAVTDVSIRLNPFEYHDCYHAKAIAAYLRDDFEQCLDFLRNVTSSESGGGPEILSAACHARLGQRDEARDAVSTFLDAAREHIADYPGDDPAAWRRYWARQYPFRDAADLERLFDGLRLAEFPV
jgi:adenylate cyclase